MTPLTCLLIDDDENDTIIFKQILKDRFKLLQHIIGIGAGKMLKLLPQENPTPARHFCYYLCYSEQRNNIETAESGTVFV